MPININLSNLFKSIIVEEDLIDTGALLKSIRVFVDIRKNMIIVNITSKYYVKYLKDKYHLVEQFKGSNVYIEEISNLIMPLFEKQIMGIIDGEKVSPFDPVDIILINGNKI